MKRNLFLILILGFGVVQASGNEEVDHNKNLEIIDVVSVDGSQPSSRDSSFRNPYRSQTNSGLTNFRDPHEELEKQNDVKGEERPFPLQITQSRSMNEEDFKALKQFQEALRIREEALNQQ